MMLISQNLDKQKGIHWNKTLSQFENECDVIFKRISTSGPAFQSSNFFFTQVRIFLQAVHA